MLAHYRDRNGERKTVNSRYATAEAALAALRLLRLLRCSRIPWTPLFCRFLLSKKKKKDSFLLFFAKVEEESELLRVTVQFFGIERPRKRLTD